MDRVNERWIDYPRPYHHAYSNRLWHRSGAVDRITNSRMRDLLRAYGWAQVDSQGSSQILIDAYTALRSEEPPSIYREARRLCCYWMSSRLIGADSRTLQSLWWLYIQLVISSLRSSSMRFCKLPSVTLELARLRQCLLFVYCQIYARQTSSCA